MTHPLKVLGILLTIQFWVQICLSSVTWDKYNKIVNTHLTNSLVQIQQMSVTTCITECNIYSWCRGLSYKPSSQECHLTDIHCRDIGPTGEADNEWVTFVKNASACIGYLVSGPDGINNSQLTASSSFPGHEAWHARLNTTVGKSGGWAKVPDDTNVYLQADFVHVKVITTFALQGRALAAYPTVQFVTRFKVLTSLDCLSFSFIVDDSDDEKVFDGNSHPEEIVTRYLQRGWVLARCVRINPVEWFGWPTLRFDVLGF